MSGVDDRAARRRAVTMAGHSGDVATVRAGLLDDDAGVRASALGGLERLGALDDGILATALADASPLVRRRAAAVSARHPELSLLGLLSDPDPTVVEMAAFACGEREEPDAAVVSRLSELATRHADALVREAAVASLGAIGAQAGVEAILAATTDKPAVRRRAVIALAPFEGPEVDSALAAALQDRDWQVRQAAEDLLAP